MKMMLTAALAALPALAAAQMAMPTPTPRQYVMKAGASDQYEIQSSRLVLATTRNPALRDFATMMISDHQKSTADVKAAAMQDHVMAGPPMLDAAGARDIRALRAARGTARDQLYLSQQKTAHQKALMLQQTYANGGTSEPLKMVAGNIVPVVQHHIEMLTSM